VKSHAGSARPPEGTCRPATEDVGARRRATSVRWPHSRPSCSMSAPSASVISRNRSRVVPCGIAPGSRRGRSYQHTNRSKPPSLKSTEPALAYARRSLLGTRLAARRGADSPHRPIRQINRSRAESVAGDRRVGSGTEGDGCALAMLPRWQSAHCELAGGWKPPCRSSRPRSGPAVPQGHAEVRCADQVPARRCTIGAVTSTASSLNTT
jgi:hypothetical protein